MPQINPGTSRSTPRGSVFPSAGGALLHLFVLCVLAGGLVIPAMAVPPRSGLSHTLTPLSPPVQAPGFSLEDLDERRQALADYRGKVVIVNFWAVWCPPCRKEMPSLERLHQHFKDRPFAILAINEGEDADRIEPFLWEMDPSPTFTVLLDRDSAIPPQWGVRGLPTSFVLDKQGQVVYRAVGGRDFDHPDVIKAVERLLEK